MHCLAYPLAVFEEALPVGRSLQSTKGALPSHTMRAQLSTYSKMYH